MSDLTHLGPDGAARMVDVGGKPATQRLAIASGRGATLCSLDAPFVAAAKQLGLEAQLLGWRAGDTCLAQPGL